MCIVYVQDGFTSPNHVSVSARQSVSLGHMRVRDNHAFVFVSIGYRNVTATTSKKEAVKTVFA